MTAVSDNIEQIEREALGQPWYHTIDLGAGRVTNGSVDLRDRASKLLPASLAGRRALDVGTFDGFWAFTLERLGAASVHAIDLASFDDTDLPPRNRPMLQARSAGQVPGTRFKLAHALLSSQVEYVQSRIYDLTPEQIGGPVDYAVVSDLLLHLRDPIGGLEAVRGCLKADGRLLLSEELNVRLTLLSPRTAAGDFQANRHEYNWWKGNLACVRGWLVQAGFVPGRPRFFRLAAVKGQNMPHVAFEATPDPAFKPSWGGQWAAPRAGRAQNVS